MDRIEIIEALEEIHGTQEPSEVPHFERWQLYENIKSNIRLSNTDPVEYSKTLILISETLEL